MTWQVFGPEFINDLLAQQIARWTHDPKVHSSILSEDVVQIFFSSKNYFLEQKQVFTCSINSKKHWLKISVMEELK